MSIFSYIKQSATWQFVSTEDKNPAGHIHKERTTGKDCFWTDMIGDKKARWKSNCALCKEWPDPINMASSLTIVVRYGYLNLSGNLSMKSILTYKMLAKLF